MRTDRIDCYFTLWITNCEQTSSWRGKTLNRSKMIKAIVLLLVACLALLHQSKGLQPGPRVCPSRYFRCNHQRRTSRVCVQFRWDEDSRRCVEIAPQNQIDWWCRQQLQTDFGFGNLPQTVRARRTVTVCWIHRARPPRLNSATMTKLYARSGICEFQ